MGQYDDIINLPHPDPKTHQRMPREQRAAQFSPFKAMVGYDAKVDEAARDINEREEFSGDTTDFDLP